MNQHPFFVEAELLSDATFSRGEGMAGVVDVDVEHDELGLPLLGGKTLRGLLRDAWLSMQDCFPELSRAAVRVFGPEADCGEHSILRIGDAVVEEEARKWIRAATTRESCPVSPAAVLEALTTIRRQTAEERSSGAPAKTSLRSVRVVIRELRLRADLLWLAKPAVEDVRCLALALLAVRHAGLARNRGRGHVRLTLDGSMEQTLQAAKGGEA